jgi:hypothetical protein
VANQTKPGAAYVFTEKVRAPFLTVVNPAKVGKKGNEKGDPVYSLTVLLKPDSVDLKAVKAAMVAVAKETWPGRDLKELKFPFQNGDEAAKEATANGKDGAFFNGTVVFRTRSGQDKPPALAVLEGKKVQELNGQQREIVGKQKFYNGCYVVPSIYIVAYKKGSEGGIGEHSGVKAYLSAVLWAGDGERIGGGSAAETFRGYAGSVTNEDPTVASDDEISF